MCISNAKLTLWKRPRIVYKVVNTDRTSKVIERFLQAGYATKGGILTYHDGAIVRSPIPATPGIFLYRTLASARAKNDRLGSIILKCRIPARTRGLKARGSQQITASRVRVLGEVS